MCGTLAQLVEQRTFNPLVTSSNLVRPTTQYNTLCRKAQGVFFGETHDTCGIDALLRMDSMQLKKIYTAHRNTATLFVATFIAVAGIAYNSQTTAQSTSASIPSSGSCALLMTLPVPLGVTIGTGFETGYNVIGQIQFTSATTGKFSGRVVNPTFNAQNSPYIVAASNVDLNDLTVTIAAMNSANGFQGGYLFTFSGAYKGNAVQFSFTGVPANNGKTILFASSSGGTQNSPGIGPGSGLCQV
jgi:hypothetical protein